MNNEEERQELANKANQWAQIGTELKKKAQNLGLEFDISTYLRGPKVKVRVYEEAVTDYEPTNQVEESQ